MSNADQHAESIANTISDYRQGDIPAPNADHVTEWVAQFDRSVRKPILAELDHILDETYVSKESFEEFLSSVLRAKKLVGDDPATFWPNVNFLNIQSVGQSQSEILRLFGELLKREFDLDLDECGHDSERFVYLDDATFTGNRVRNDLMRWIEQDAPASAKVEIVVFAFHTLGQYYASKGLQSAAAKANKKVDTDWWRVLTIEDRLTYINSSDVLRPTELPDDPPTQTYAESLKYKPRFRKPESVGTNKFFSSEDGRHVLEQELLKAGVTIRSRCPYLNEYQRPLGNMVLETLGFGSLLVTYRNCPNNCPLAFWAGDPWYPLFPRKTN